jgi:hypothetical protein
MPVTIALNFEGKIASGVSKTRPSKCVSGRLARLDFDREEIFNIYFSSNENERPVEPTKARPPKNLAANGSGEGEHRSCAAGGEKAPRAATADKINNTFRTTDPSPQPRRASWLR